MNEFTVDYIEGGPRDAAVTLVSLPGSAGLEASIAKDLLAEEYRVIEINPPGWGDRDDLNRPMHQREFGRILADAIRQLVDGDFFLLGTSAGGANALYATVHLADRVKGLIFEASMAPLKFPGQPTQPESPEPDATGPVEPAEEPEALSEEAQRAYPVPPPDPRKPWADEAYIAHQMQNRFRMFRWLQGETYPQSTFDVINERHIPVLSLVGDQDEIVVDQEEVWATALPKSDYRVIPTGTHDLQNTTPDEFVQAVRGFVSAVTSGEARPSGETVGGSSAVG